MQVFPKGTFSRNYGKNRHLMRKYNTTTVPEVLGDEIFRFREVKKNCGGWIFGGKFLSAFPSKNGLKFVTRNFTTIFTASKEIRHLDLRAPSSAPTPKTHTKLRPWSEFSLPGSLPLDRKLLHNWFGGNFGCKTLHYIIPNQSPVIAVM